MSGEFFHDPYAGHGPKRYEGIDLAEDVTGSMPQVLTSPAGVLDQLVLEVAGAPSGARMLLVSCELCRNHLLYLLDTIPYTGDAARQIRARLHALPDVHMSHGQLGHPDGSAPRIRWIAS